MIDWDRIATLRDEVGSEDFDEVVDLFISEVDETATRLRLTPDLSTLEEDLHFLKGSALNLGFVSLSSLCQKGEKMSAGGQATDVDVGSILAAYDESKIRFIAELPNAFA